MERTPKKFKHVIADLAGDGIEAEWDDGHDENDAGVEAAAESMMSLLATSFRRDLTIDGEQVTVDYQPIPSPIDPDVPYAAVVQTQQADATECSLLLPRAEGPDRWETTANGILVKLTAATLKAVDPELILRRFFGLRHALKDYDEPVVLMISSVPVQQRPAELEKSERAVAIGFFRQAGVFR